MSRRKSRHSSAPKERFGDAVQALHAWLRFNMADVPSDYRASMPITTDQGALAAAEKKVREQWAADLAAQTEESNGR